MSSSVAEGELLGSADVNNCDIADREVMGLASLLVGLLCLGTGFLRAASDENKKK